MIRAGFRLTVLIAVLTAGCASGEDTGTTPTAPTAPTPPPSAPPPQPPPPPASCLPGAATNLAVTQTASTRVLTWTAGANATDYDIQIGSSSGGSNYVRDTTTHTNYTWTGGGEGPKGPFYARVHSHNTCGSGPPSAEFVFN